MQGFEHASQISGKVRNSNNMSIIIIYFLLVIISPDTLFINDNLE